MYSSRIDWKLIFGIIFAAVLMIVSFNYKSSFWYMYGAAMLFLVSFGIFNVDLQKKNSFIKGVIPAVFSAVILYVIFYIGAFILKIMPFGLDHSVQSAFHRFATDDWYIWILMIVAIVPGEEIFWRGFVLQRLLNAFQTWFAILLATVILTVIVAFSGSFALTIGMFAATLFWNFLYVWRPSLLMTYLSHLLFVFLLLAALPIY
ncbi:CPBP family intramembrane glutamic endopeptidase [Listeria costaricensis]|uniref:CPBP family intramembrane glutamic endopeptidase n=1 Tax=Listeria costaricensis TaxID=2026604 RepID=UPI000C08B9EF|nr:CPBP family intramembrane glutamic endopeptidase [Listeria costaricensis]